MAWGEKQMWTTDEANEGHQQGGPLKKHLRRVRKRKQNRQATDRADPFACGVVAYKMKLVEDRRRRDHGS